MEDTSKAWRFCVVGNIVKQHTDGENVFYGTKEFAGGTKVYINDRTRRSNDGSVTVIGLNRFKRYALERIPMEWIDNIRLQRVYKPAVLNIIDYYEAMEGFYWRGRTAEDRRNLEAFIEEWKPYKEFVANSPWISFENPIWPAFGIGKNDEEIWFAISVYHFHALNIAIEILWGGINEYADTQITYCEWKELLVCARTFLSATSFEKMQKIIIENSETYKHPQAATQFCYKKCGEKIWQDKEKHLQMINDLERWTGQFLCENDYIMIYGF